MLKSLDLGKPLRQNFYLVSMFGNNIFPVGALKLASDPLFIAAQRERALKRMQDPKFRYMMATPCVCVETGQVFKSQADAAKFVGGRPQTISRAASGKRQTAYGYHWKNQE